MAKTRFNKLTAWLLTLAMLMTFIPGFTIGVSASGGTGASIYQQMLEHIKPENKYGLGDIPESRIFHAWGWSYQNIMARLEDIAVQGFSTILVSPPNEMKMATKDIKFQEPEVDGISPNGWWMLYQPAAFQINDSHDNALGTKSEFIELCDDAHAIGLKIMVEAVVGSVGTDDDHVGEYDNVSEDPMAHVNPRTVEFEPEILAANAFHSPWRNSEFKSYEGGFDDREIEESLTQHAINAKPDLATEEQVVQDAIYDYFVELVEAGADGFYFNDAKHIETSSDTFFPSDFWEDTLVKLRKNYHDKKLPAIAEMIDGPGDGRSTAGYLQSGMNLTHTAMSDVIRDSVINGTDITAAFDDEFPQENSVLWGESYKSYANGETSSLTSEQRAKIWALTASRKGGKGIYLARPSDKLAENKNEVNNILSTITIGEANVTDWSTEAVKSVNHFASFFENADENAHYDNGFAVIERGEVGAALVNMNGNNAQVSLSEKTLVNGNYTDAITGNEFTVENGKISGEIGESGIAVLYLSDIVSLYNIWVGGERLVSNNPAIYTTDDNGDITGSATYDYTTNTLFLNDFTSSSDGDINAAICYTGSDDLNLVLKGTSNITCTNSSGFGVYAQGNIEISGSGSLSVTGGNCGVNTMGNMTVLGGSLSANGNSYGVTTIGSITVSGGSLSAYGNSYGVNTMGSITISGGSLSANGNSYSVNTLGSITVSGGSLLANGGNCGVNAMDSITVSGGSLSATGNSYGVNTIGGITVSGGSLSATGNNYGVNAMDSIALSDGTTIVQGGTAAFIKAPVIDSSFTNAAVWYGESESSADSDGAKDISELADNYYQKYVRIGVPAFIITFEPSGGSVEPASLTTVDGKLESLPLATRSGYRFNGWYDAEDGGNKITTDTVFTEDTTVYAQWTKRSSGGGGGSSNTTTTTTKNEDGSTTKTTTNKATGTTTETTTYPDGSTTKVETKKDGTVTTSEKDKDGNTTTTVEKPDGTSTTTEKNKDGSEKVTEEKADGTTVTTEKDTDGTKTVTTENADGSKTTEETKKDGTNVTTETTADGETKTEIDLPKDKETEVTIPVDNAEYVTKVVVTDKDGKETEVEFEVKDGGVAISVSGDCTAVVNKAAKKVFDDVHPVNHWAIADVDYVFAKGLMNGVSETHFVPNDNLTRAMLVTVLYRAEGEPAVNKSIPFADVDMDSYYANAVTWAQQNGIVKGVSETDFAPDDNITREQIAAIMHRYAQYKGYDVSVGENTNILSYDDFDSISEYATAAMQYAVGSGILRGKTTSTLNPLDNAARAEIAAILHRFIESNK